MQLTPRPISTADLHSPNGGAYRGLDAAYGYGLLTTSEPILQMAPSAEPRAFLVKERIRCNAPAIRSPQGDRSDEKRYSCRLRRVIADALNQPRPICPKDDE